MEVLSQSQIDDLLNSLTTGAMDLDTDVDDISKKVKEYDFRTPKRFTKEQLKIVSSVYENFARLLSSYLTGMLRLYVEIECVHIEETRYSDFNNALPDSVMMALGEVQFSGSSEDSNTIMLDLSKTISFAIIERLLGGTGDGLDVDREFTEIELSLMENVFRGTFPQMSDAWSNYFELDVLFRKIETNARLMQAISADDTVVVVMLDIKMKDLQGAASVCVPAVCLEDILKKIDSQYMRNLKRINSAGDKERRELVMNYLQESDLELRCVIGEAQVNLKDIIYLNVGDVIQLSKPVNSLIDLDVGKSCWFKGKMGIQRGKKAIQIKEVL
ncbi:flagellar motor switch protein FliM [Ruminococcaceae bacterium OttesenSCG-928-L11]|nr:flagellar motor switch protein FliM [Ruminococcaceae bacterium OttesenSCG-928-L11]